jgi:hypothetical protein
LSLSFQRRINGIAIWQQPRSGRSYTLRACCGEFFRQLNQIELWWSRIERDLLARGIFTLVADLARASVTPQDRYATRSLAWPRDRDRFFTTISTS